MVRCGGGGGGGVNLGWVPIRLDPLTWGSKPGPVSWLGTQVTQLVDSTTTSGACLPDKPRMAWLTRAPGWWPHSRELPMANRSVGHGHCLGRGLTLAWDKHAYMKKCFGPLHLLNSGKVTRHGSCS